MISPDLAPRFTGEVVIVSPFLNLLDPDTFPVTVPSAFWTKLLMVGMLSLDAPSEDLFWLDKIRIVPKLSPTDGFFPHSTKPVPILAFQKMRRAPAFAWEKWLPQLSLPQLIFLSQKRLPQSSLP